MKAPDAYNPANPEFGGHYILTTREGYKYDIDASTGKINSLSDPNGNTAHYSDGGISATDAGGNVLGQIIINRTNTTYPNLITSIIDPAGKSIVYGYNSSGDLTSVTDRTSNQTQFVYAISGRPHFLTLSSVALHRIPIQHNHLLNRTGVIPALTCDKIN